MADQLRRVLGPVVAVSASCLALVCVVSVTDVIHQVGELAAIQERFVGWLGVGLAMAWASGFAMLLLADRAGGGLPLALGAAAAVFGLALSRGVVSDVQIVMGSLILGLAVGCLVVGGASVALEIPGRLGMAGLVGWGLPLVSGWPVLVWLALHVDRGDEARLTLHPSVWSLAIVSAMIVLWASLSMLLEPPRRRASVVGWEGAWTLLAFIAVAVCCLVMLFGFEPGIRLVWVRPVVVIATAASVFGLALVSWLIPISAARIGYLATGLVALCVPTCIQLWVSVADAGDTPVPWPAVAVLVVVCPVGAALGWLRPQAGVTVGPLVMAAAAAGGWVMPDAPWLMVVAAGPFLAAASAVFFAGLRQVAPHAMAVRLVTMSVLVTLLLGLTVAVPASWALGGQVPVESEDARAAGRAILGLTFALAVLASAYLSVLVGRERHHWRTTQGETMIEGWRKDGSSSSRVSPSS